MAEEPEATNEELREKIGKSKRGRLVKPAEHGITTVTFFPRMARRLGGENTSSTGRIRRC